MSPGYERFIYFKDLFVTYSICAMKCVCVSDLLNVEGEKNSLVTILEEHNNGPESYPYGGTCNTLIKVQPNLLKLKTRLNI